MTTTTIEERLLEAGGRCECTGQCGHNHRWQSDEPAERCRVPHACRVQRKRDHRSNWVLAGTDSAPLAYPEFYEDEIETVTLRLVNFRSGPRVVCGFCLRGLKEEKERRVRGTGPTSSSAG